MHHPTASDGQKRLGSKEGPHLHRRHRYLLRLHEAAALAIQKSNHDQMLEESDILEVLMAETAVWADDPPNDEEMKRNGEAPLKALPE